MSAPFSEINLSQFVNKSANEITVPKIKAQDSTGLKLYNQSDNGIFIDDTEYKVGIGTNEPKAQLDINGYGNVNGQWNGSGYSYNSGAGHGWGYSGSGQYSNQTYSLKCSHGVTLGGRFVVGKGTYANSDKRIKKDIQDLSDGECLNIIRQLKPQKYTYINDVSNQPQVYGFMAQDISNLIPSSVYLERKEIPNIYELCDVSDGNIINFKEFDVHNLINDNSHNICIQGIDNTFHTVCYEEVLDVSGQNSIKIKEDITELCGDLYDNSGVKVDGTYCFIYGQIVDDFHQLRKESIWTVATAALQELDRKQQLLEERLKALEI